MSRSCNYKKVKQCRKEATHIAVITVDDSEQYTRFLCALHANDVKNVYYGLDLAGVSVFAIKEEVMPRPKST